MPLISVIVPVYKVEKYIHRCVDSILAQTFTDFELILVDDGSPDNCGKICDEYAEKDSRIVVIHQENGGLSAARNAGLDWMYEHSNSQWISFVDSDDWIHEETLQLMFDQTQKEVNIVVCGYKNVSSKEDEQKNINEISELWNPEDFYCSNYVNATVAWGKLYRRKCFENVRFPYGLIHEDEYVTYKLLFSEKTISFIPDALYSYYSNPTGIMNSKWSEKRLDLFGARDQQLEYFKKHKFEKAYDLILKKYFNNVAYSFDIATRSNHSEALKRIRKKLIMLFYKMVIFGKLNLKSNAYALEILFPNLMKFYWLYKAFCKKINTIGFFKAFKMALKRVFSNFT